MKWKSAGNRHERGLNHESCESCIEACEQGAITVTEID
jgi:ferredoxin